MSATVTVILVNDKIIERSDHFYIQKTDVWDGIQIKMRPD